MNAFKCIQTFANDYLIAVKSQTGWLKRAGWVPMLSLVINKRNNVMIWARWPLSSDGYKNGDAMFVFMTSIAWQLKGNKLFFGTRKRPYQNNAVNGQNRYKPCAYWLNIPTPRPSTDMIGRMQITDSVLVVKLSHIVHQYEECLVCAVYNSACLFLNWLFGWCSHIELVITKRFKLDYYLPVCFDSFVGVQSVPLPSPLPLYL